MGVGVGTGSRIDSGIGSMPWVAKGCSLVGILPSFGYCESWFEGSPGLDGVEFLEKLPNVLGPLKDPCPVLNPKKSLVSARGAVW